MLIHWLKEQLHCETDKIIIPLLDKYEIEFSTTNHTTETKNPILFMVLEYNVFRNSLIAFISERESNIIWTT